MDITEGDGPFAFLWDDGQQTAEAVNLRKGSYLVKVTDAESVYPPTPDVYESLEGQDVDEVELTSATGLAQGLGASADPFLMAVAVGSSCAFLTPIGHQSNTIVMGPGGYRFGDYWRLGLPLSILVVVVGTPLIALIFPFHAP